MKYRFDPNPVPFDAYSKFDAELEFFDSEANGGWLGEVNRSSSEYIRWVQRSLNQILGTRLAVDGGMGLQTRSAIRTFQRQSGLVADGIVGLQTERALINAGVNPPLGTGAAVRNGALSASAIVRSVPGLIKPAPELYPPMYTLYVEIDLKIIDQKGKKLAEPMTGIFIPMNYSPKSKVDLILYLHGHKGAYPGANVSIDGYWSCRRPPLCFPLREELNAGNKNVILVAPTLGPKSEYGLLTKPTEFNKYLDQVMAALKAYGPHKAQAQFPAVAKIILACHSGGGSPMFKLAKLKGGGGHADNILECWGFDCLYANKPKDAVEVKEKKQAWLANEWANWARSHPEAKLFIYYLQSTAGTSEKLKYKKLANVFVEWSKAAENLAKGWRSSDPWKYGHYWVPKAHWKRRIQDARFLLDR